MDEDRKRAEALLHEILYGKGNASAILAAFAEERRLERERIFGSVSAGGPIRAAGASAGPAEGEGRAARDLGSELEWTGDPRAEAAPSAQPPLAEPSPPTPQASETPAEGEAWDALKLQLDYAEKIGRAVVTLDVPEARALLARRPHGR